MSFSVVGIGEVLWDLLPSGPQLGGAPANFAFHAQSLGAESCLVSRVGEDDLGLNVLARIEAQRLPRDTIQLDEEQPTGTVTVRLSSQGCPEFEIREHAAWDYLQVSEAAIKAVRGAAAVCFGSLAQRHPTSRATITRLLAETRPQALRIFDINLRQNFFSGAVIEESLRLANVLKLDDDELAVLAGMFALSGDARAQIKALSAEFELDVIVLTRGARGSVIYQTGRWSEQQAQPVLVCDTVGAGDAFTAALTLGLLHRMELTEMHALAEQVARHVCSQSGATPPLPEAIRVRFRSAN